MSSTLVRYGGKGFEANDSTLEVWLALLVDEIDKLPDTPDWLLSLRERWETSATVYFGFGVMTWLDEYVTDDQRRALVLKLCKRAFERLKAFGNPLPQAELNSIRTWGEESGFTGSPDASIFLRTACFFISLLENRDRPDDSEAWTLPEAVS